MMVFPSSTVWAIILFIAIYALAAGILDIVVAFFVRDHVKQHSAAQVSIKTP